MTRELLVSLILNLSIKVNSHPPFPVYPLRHCVVLGKSSDFKFLPFVHLNSFFVLVPDFPLKSPAWCV